MSEANPAVHRPVLHSIQALRGLAALAVVFFHLNVLASKRFDTAFFAFGRGGHLGVDFFFVLSGFIIYFVHHRDVGVPARLEAYVLRRASRIYPIYWLVCLALLPLYALVPSFGDGGETAPLRVIHSLLLVPGPSAPFVGVAWTLVHEIFFYAMFALAIALGRKALAVYASWLVALVGLHVTGMASGHFLPAFLASTHNLEFLAGVLAAAVFLRVEGKHRLAWPLAIAGGVLSAEALANYYAGWVVIDPPLVFGPAFGLLLLGVVLVEHGPGLRVPKALGALGDASFVLYLIHYYVLSAAGKAIPAVLRVAPLPPVLLLALAACAAVGLAWLGHRLVERPVLAWCHRRMPRG